MLAQAEREASYGLIDALGYIGVEQVVYETINPYLSIQDGEGELIGQILDDGVEIVVNREPHVICTKDFLKLADFLRVVDYSVRYLMIHRNQFPEFVPEAFQIGSEITD